MTSQEKVKISRRVKPEGDSYYWDRISFKGDYGYIREDFVTIDNDELVNTGNIKRVFIDPGHGGEDSGAVGHVVERDIVLSISEKLGEILRLKGIAVQYSRTSNSTAVELSERSKMANSWGGDIFLSIHCNSANSPASGTETFVYTSPSEASKNLASKIVNSISSELSLNNRGMKYANFVVLRESAMPAVLIETAFVNHSSDANKLLYDKQKFANAIANVILGFSVGGNNGSIGGNENTGDNYDTNAEYHRMLRIATPFMQGADVKQIQTKLNSLGYSVGTVDGIFGYVTEEKVRSFQRAKGLDVDGRVGRITWDTLMNTSSSGSNNGAYDSNANYHRVLRYTTPSMQGADIKQVQTKLNNLGYSVGVVDGVFGQVTEEKVKSFQKAKWLDVDGVVGRLTWDALMNTSSGGSDNGVYDSNANYHRVLQIATPSMKGADVKKVQTKLNNLGYSVGSVDGTFGQITAEKVKSFQKAKGLGVDGKVGSITWNALMNSSSSGGSNSGAYDSNANYHRVLRYTTPLMQGADVKQVQTKLNSLKYSVGSADGSYGQATKDGVIKFQKAKGLSADGVVGGTTWNTLMKSSSGGGNTGSIPTQIPEKVKYVTNGITTILRKNGTIAVTCDSELYTYLEKPHNGSTALASDLKQHYEKVFKRPFKVSRDSMAVEILCHAHPKKLLQWAKLFFAISSLGTITYPLLQLVINKLINSTKVADIGENTNSSNKDENRVVFDKLSTKSTSIFNFFGKYA